MGNLLIFIMVDYRFILLLEGSDDGVIGLPDCLQLLFVFLLERSQTGIKHIKVVLCVLF